jgi:hypothetical protein
MKVADLKAALKARGLTISGNKAELTERLQLALMNTTDEDKEAEALLAEDDEEVPLKAPKKKVAIKRDNPAPMPPAATVVTEK